MKKLDEGLHVTSILNFTDGTDTIQCRASIHNVPKNPVSQIPPHGTPHAHTDLECYGAATKK